MIISIDQHISIQISFCHFINLTSVTYVQNQKYGMIHIRTVLDYQISQHTYLIVLT